MPPVDGWALVWFEVEAVQMSASSGGGWVIRCRGLAEPCAFPVCTAGAVTGEGTLAPFPVLKERDVCFSLGEERLAVAVAG